MSRIRQVGDAAEKIGGVFNKRSELRDGQDERLIAALDAADRRQVELNALDAQGASFFQRGWRPFIGWGCGTAMIANSLLPWVSHFTGQDIPPIDMTQMMPVLLAILGVGGMRSYDKFRRVQASAQMSPRQRRRSRRN